MPIKWGPSVLRATRTVILPASTDSGGFTDSAGFNKFEFQVTANGSVIGLQLTFYYTNDPVTTWGVGTRWSVMAAPSEQSGTGIVSNPITAADGSQSMIFANPILGWKAVTNAFTGGGSVVINALSRD